MRCFFRKKAWCFFSTRKAEDERWEVVVSEWSHCRDLGGLRNAVLEQACSGSDAVCGRRRAGGPIREELLSDVMLKEGHAVIPFTSRQTWDVLLGRPAEMLITRCSLDAHSWGGTLRCHLWGEGRLAVSVIKELQQREPAVHNNSLRTWIENNTTCLSVCQLCGWILSLLKARIHHANRGFMNHPFWYNQKPNGHAKSDSRNNGKEWAKTPEMIRDSKDYY